MIIRKIFRQRRQWRPSWTIEDAPLLFVDLETTGLHPERGHSIVEAAVLDDGGVRYLGGQSDAGALGEDEERAMVRDVLEAVEEKIVVGHNIPFDLRFLAERSKRLDISMPRLGFIDTLGLARRFLEDPEEELTLEYVARRLELEIPDELHRAAPDARLARDAFRALVDSHGLETLTDVRIRKFEVHGH